ncbi:MAG: acyltransferase [Phenylobacterium zucineum]|nr:MAG: acyltransferase [Phenylobacterium zucineum]
MTVAQTGPEIQARNKHDHIVDRLIVERAPRLAGLAIWPLARPLLYKLLDYRKARAMADAIAPLSGKAAVDAVSNLLSIQLTVRCPDRIPARGRLIVIANHPTGIADGIAVYDALKGIRSDLCFYANADAHRVCPGLIDLLIPVEWVADKRTRERTRLTLNMTRQVMEAEQALVIFPAGKLARQGRDGRLAESPWMTTAASLARKYEAPILPLHVRGPWSTLFHLFHHFSGELRDITLFHELLNKRGGAFSVDIGPLIGWRDLDPDPARATEALKTHVALTLDADPDRAFP